MSQPIDAFQGDRLYLDTNAFYLFLRALAPDAQALFRRIRQGDVQAFTSALTFDELAYRMSLALIRDKYNGSPLDRLRQSPANMIAEFHPQLEPHLLQSLNYQTGSCPAFCLVAPQSRIRRFGCYQRGRGGEYSNSIVDPIVKTTN